jgi:hypothetical protein
MNITFKPQSPARLSPYLVTVDIPSEDKPDACLLCSSCRKKQSTGINASIPIPLVSRFIISRLREWKLFQNPDSQVKSYVDALNTDFEKMWEEYRKKKAQPRAGQLFTEDDSQSKLF